MGKQNETYERINKVCLPFRRSWQIWGEEGLEFFT